MRPVQHGKRTLVTFDAQRRCPTDSQSRYNMGHTVTLKGTSRSNSETQSVPTRRRGGDTKDVRQESWRIN